MIVNLVLERMVIITNVIFIGQYGTISEIAGVGIGNLILNLLVQTFVLGINDQQAVYISRGFTTNNKRLMGDYYNKTQIIIMGVIAVNFTIIFFLK